MILIAETVHPGEVHAEINSALVAMLREARRDTSIMMMAEDAHIQALKRYRRVADARVSFQAFRHRFVSKKCYWQWKILGEWLRIFSVIRAARKCHPSLLVWTALFPTGHWLVRILTPFLLHKQRQVVVLHGELSYLEHTSRLSEKALHFFLKAGLRRGRQPVRFIVLSDPIAVALLNQQLCCPNQISVLPHPFDYRLSGEKISEPDNTLGSGDDKKTNINLRLNDGIKPLHIGTFGSLQARKNIHLLFQLADILEDLVRDKRLIISASGKCSPEIRAENRGELVQLSSSNQFMPREALRAEIAQLDLALFFHDKAAYRYTASGAVHEAIRLHRPVLALGNSYMKWLVRQGAGIKLFESVEDMAEYIRQILDGRHQIEVQKLRHANARFCLTHTLEQQSTVLAQILDK